MVKNILSFGQNGALAFSERAIPPFIFLTLFVFYSRYIMSRVGTDLPGLQNLIKRDPIMYHEEFLQQVVLVVLMSNAV